ncbi:hypothetical protein JAAARDRAFT_200176 [Jaapia argillacea MUCL 33604]|uniref:Uncharacterized protein n=1 Tax=Jaapia argillacea MUCL 33604 TaxID=933084 RepID=A0A067P5W6_9AGAM|nr:hypothetical protein JAAARDRAFT_200176 [Jaapia argillacea MUCL 33604]
MRPFAQGMYTFSYRLGQLHATIPNASPRDLDMWAVKIRGEWRDFVAAFSSARNVATQFPDLYPQPQCSCLAQHLLILMDRCAQAKRDFVGEDLAQLNPQDPLVNPVMCDDWLPDWVHTLQQLQQLDQYWLGESAPGPSINPVALGAESIPESKGSHSANPDRSASPAQILAQLKGKMKTVDNGACEPSPDTKMDVDDAPSEPAPSKKRPAPAPDAPKVPKRAKSKDQPTAVPLHSSQVKGYPAEVTKSLAMMYVQSCNPCLNSKAICAQYKPNGSCFFCSLKHSACDHRANNGLELMPNPHYNPSAPCIKIVRTAPPGPLTIIGSAPALEVGGAPGIFYGPGSRTFEGNAPGTSKKGSKTAKPDPVPSKLRPRCKSTTQLKSKERITSNMEDNSPAPPKPTRAPRKSAAPPKLQDHESEPGSEDKSDDLPPKEVTKPVTKPKSKIAPPSGGRTTNKVTVTGWVKAYDDPKVTTGTSVAVLTMPMRFPLVIPYADRLAQDESSRERARPSHRPKKVSQAMEDAIQRAVDMALQHQHHTVIVPLKDNVRSLRGAISGLEKLVKSIQDDVSKLQTSSATTTEILQLDGKLDESVRELQEHLDAVHPWGHCG